MTGNMAPTAVDAGKIVTINGNGNQIDGGSAFRPFYAHQGNITIRDLASGAWRSRDLNDSAFEDPQYRKN